jgi:hypothetical protein
MVGALTAISNLQFAICIFPIPFFYRLDMVEFGIIGWQMALLEIHASSKSGPLMDLIRSLFRAKSGSNSDIVRPIGS